jgi:hypothetical protein
VCFLEKEDGTLILSALCQDLCVWHNATMVARASGCYGDPFKAGRGVTQGGPLSPTRFNVVVDAVIRHWLSIVCEDAMDTEGFGLECQRKTALFYADDGLVASTDEEWLQGAFDLITL